MSGANMCSHFLFASRRTAEKNGTRTDRAMVVLGDEHCYFVESFEGEIVWEGQAHCKFCARAEAINHMAGESA